MRSIWIAILCLLSACKSTSLDQSQLQESTRPKALNSPQEIQGQTLWDDYVRDAERAYPVQAGCRPASFLHKGQRKGSLLLFHGFTACPQQFFDLAERLKNEGFDVYLPLTPGHGMQRQLPGRAEDSLLPNKENYQQLLYPYVLRMNTIMADVEGPIKVVGGISLGSTLAADALSSSPQLYQRAILVTPFFQMSGFIANVVGGLKNIDNFAEAIRPDFFARLTSQALAVKVGWGENCEKEAKAGRQGICNFQFTHLIGAQQYGYEFSQSKNIKGTVQMVGVEKDGAVDNNRIKTFFEKNIDKTSGQRKLCFYRAPANHSLASRYDSPDENKFWLPAFEEDFVAFVSNGKLFPSGEKTIENYEECRS